MMYQYLVFVVVGCILITYLYDVFVWCICMTHLYDVFIWYICMYDCLHLSDIYVFVFVSCICMMPTNYKLIMRLSVFEAEAALACSARVTAPLGIELRYFSCTSV